MCGPAKTPAGQAAGGGSGMGALGEGSCSRAKSAAHNRPRIYYHNRLRRAGAGFRGQNRKFPSDSPIARPAHRAYNLPVQAADTLLAELEGPLPPPDPSANAAPTPRGSGFGLLPTAQADRPGFPGPRKLSYTHEDCVEFIVQNPAATQKELSARYGYTEVWISRIIASDAFQAAVAKRRNEVLSPDLIATAEENFKALILKTQSYLLEQLSLKPTPQLALGALTVASRAMGYGARDTKVEVNNTFVVALPPASKTSEDWSKTHTLEGEARPA